MDIILYYAVEKRLTPEDGRIMEHETIVCQGTEIECHQRIRELRDIQTQQTESDTESGIQIEPEYFVVPAEEYDEKHSLKQQRSIMDKFNLEFGCKGGLF